MAQVFKPHANIIAPLSILAVVLVVAVILVTLYGLAFSPLSTGEALHHEQPIPFSHRLHVGEVGIDCRYCHSDAEVAPGAGMPSTETCMSCHSQVWRSSEVLQPVRDSWNNDTPIHWTRVHDLPDYVRFDHSAHVNNGVGCEACHGQVEAMDGARQTVSLNMSWCLDCHRHTREAKESTLLEDCSICHQ